MRRFRKSNELPKETPAGSERRPSSQDSGASRFADAPTGETKSQPTFQTPSLSLPKSGGAFLLLIVAGACSSPNADMDQEKNELVHIRRPSESALGVLSVIVSGAYTHWYSGDASKPVRRGQLSESQLASVRNATSDSARQSLMACVATDFDRCTAEQGGYIMTTRSGTGCWAPAEVESCDAAQHFAVLTGLLRTIAAQESK